ncbi:MAG: hypothetical protein JZU47_09730 [Prolixibacteraceae bacterium]|nr:hypothetical protein [Prolixibacteraceae bacterium]
MGVRIPHTSSIDRFLNIPRLIVSFCYVATFVGGIVYIFDESNIIENLKLNKTVEGIIFIALMIGSYFLAVKFYSKTAGRFFNTLSAFLYVRDELKTKISWKEAGFVSFLFTHNGTGKWFPMYNVLKLPEKERVNFIIDYAKNYITVQNEKQNG